jgi:hypothetical protein
LTIINGGETARTGGNNCRGVQEEACDVGSQKDVRFAQGKRINFIVTNAPGREFSVSTHAAAPDLQKYIHGTTVMVTNVPDAGALSGRTRSTKSRRTA